MGVQTSASSAATGQTQRPPSVVSPSLGVYLLQKGQLFHNGRNGRATKKGHYRTENCTKQEAPPEDKRPTISQIPRCPLFTRPPDRPPPVGSRPPPRRADGLGPHLLFACVLGARQRDVGSAALRPFIRMAVAHAVRRGARAR